MQIRGPVLHRAPQQPVHQLDHRRIARILQQVTLAGAGGGFLQLEQNTVFGFVALVAGIIGPRQSLSEPRLVQPGDLGQIVAQAPLCLAQANLRAPLSETLIATDATPGSGGTSIAAVPASVQQELQKAAAAAPRGPFGIRRGAPEPARYCVRCVGADS